VSYTATMENICDSTGIAILANASSDNTNCASKTTLGIAENGTKVGFRGKRSIKSDCAGYTICRICLVDKPDTDYYPRYGTCKACCYKRNRKNLKKEKAILYSKAFNERNPEYRAIRSKKWRLENTEKARAAVRASVAKNPEKKKLREKDRRDKNADQVRASGRASYHRRKEARREKVNAANRERSRSPEHKERMRIKRKEDITHRLRCLLRKRVTAFLTVKTGRAGSAVRDLGCSVAALKAHLESQFKDGMTWSNQGIDGWHIDHIVPLAYFDLTDRREFLIACHYTNLQPMWAKDNMLKSNQLSEDLKTLTRQELLDLLE
jgi:hypothetical protein